MIGSPQEASDYSHSTTHIREGGREREGDRKGGREREREGIENIIPVDSLLHLTKLI